MLLPFAGAVPQGVDMHSQLSQHNTAPRQLADLTQAAPAAGVEVHCGLPSVQQTAWSECDQPSAATNAPATARSGLDHQQYVAGRNGESRS